MPRKHKIGAQVRGRKRVVSDKVLNELYNDGYTITQMAEHFQCTREAIWANMTRIGLAHKYRSYYIKIRHDISEILFMIATERGITVNELIQRTMNTVVRDDLFTAVLDE